jgi:cell division protein FtsN
MGILAWYARSALDIGREKSSAEKSVAPASKPVRPAEGRPDAPKHSATERFEFYDMLPDAEVQIAEQPRAPGAAPPPVSVPGTYVIQAGAFPNFAEADKVKARLALLGVVAEIQTADANGVLFHRVRIGPIDDLDQLNRLRARLRQNGIEYLVIPVGE